MFSTFDAEVVHCVASVNDRVGGPARSVIQLVRYLGELGRNAGVVAIDYPELGKSHGSAEVNVKLISIGKAGKALRGLQREYFRTLINCQSVKIIHNNGLWMMPNRYARIAADKLRVPLVVSPRGMLEPWSLKRNRILKCLSWALYERKNLKRASLFHATSDAEAESIRRVGFQQPIAVIPNGVFLDRPAVPPDRRLLEFRFPQLKAKRWLLFMSRIHPKKGVERLIRVWRSLSVFHPEVCLVVAGADLDGYESVVRCQVEGLGLSDSVCLTGNLDGEEKICALTNSWGFVLPTFSENFGIVVAEALSCGLPVITTRGAPWGILEEFGAGYWIENEDDALSEAIQKLLLVDRSGQQLMGQRGIALVNQHFRWPEIARQMDAVYHWLLVGGQRPDCIKVFERSSKVYPRFVNRMLIGN